MRRFFRQFCQGLYPPQFNSLESHCSMKILLKLAVVAALCLPAEAVTLQSITLLPPVNGYNLATNSGTVQLAPLCTRICLSLLRPDDWLYRADQINPCEDTQDTEGGGGPRMPRGSGRYGPISIQSKQTSPSPDKSKNSGSNSWPI